jgi:hypothetical protein
MKRKDAPGAHLPADEELLARFGDAIDDRIAEVVDEPASTNPTLHLCRLDGGQIAGHYMACFDRVWETAKPWHGEEA